MVRQAKDSPKISDGEVQRSIESWGQKASLTTIRQHLQAAWEGSKEEASAVIHTQAKPPTVCQTPLGLSIEHGHMIR